MRERCAMPLTSHALSKLGSLCLFPFSYRLLHVNLSLLAVCDFI